MLVMPLRGAPKNRNMNTDMTSVEMTRAGCPSQALRFRM